jgi:hypothetical protein
LWWARWENHSRRSRVLGEQCEGPERRAKGKDVRQACNENGRLKDETGEQEREWPARRRLATKEVTSNKQGDEKARRRRVSEDGKRGGERKWRRTKKMMKKHANKRQAWKGRASNLAPRRSGWQNGAKIGEEKVGEQGAPRRAATKDEAASD